MARLSEIFSRTFIRYLERRSARANGSDGDDPGEEESVREVQALLEMIREKNALIERLKTTDATRSQTSRKIKERWRSKQKEVKNLQAKNRTFRRLLRKRRARLRETVQRVRDLERAVAARASEQAMAIVGEPVPHSFAGRPSRNLGEAVIRRIARISDWPWRHWMRLGNFFQYDPRPLTADRIPKVRRLSDGWPRFTVVTPSFQQARFLEHTMLSVLDQDYPNLEYMVLDGGSDDGSAEIIRRNSDRLAYWRSATDQGQASAIAEGLERGTGDIMCWLNSDDLILPGVLAFVAEYFQRHPDVDVVYGNRIIIDEKGFETGRWVLPPHDPEMLTWADFIPQECTFWRRQIYEKVGGIDTSFKFAMDWDLFLRFQRAGARIVRLPYFMGAFRIHPSQKNMVTIGSDGHREMKRIRDHALGNLYQKGSLQKRIDWMQGKAVMCTVLWRLGIRF